jgi:hypothetical protein
LAVLLSGIEYRVIQFDVLYVGVTLLKVLDEGVSIRVFVGLLFLIMKVCSLFLSKHLGET